MAFEDRVVIHRRLRTLAILEFVNIPLQAWIWFWQVGFPLSGANLAGFALFAFLLFQGGAYWLAKDRQLVDGDGVVRGLRAFTLLRVANAPVLACGLAFTIWSVAAGPSRASVPGLVFAVVAVLEYVNYFYVQLMHDNRADLQRLRRTGLRKSHLARDLARYHSALRA